MLNDDESWFWIIIFLWKQTDIDRSMDPISNLTNRALAGVKRTNTTNRNTFFQNKNNHVKNSLEILLTNTTRNHKVYYILHQIGPGKFQQTLNFKVSKVKNPEPEIFSDLTYTILII